MSTDDSMYCRPKKAGKSSQTGPAAPACGPKVPGKSPYEPQQGRPARADVGQCGPARARCGPEGPMAFGQAGAGAGEFLGRVASSWAHSAGGTACRSVAARPRWPPPARATHLSSSQVGVWRKSLGCNWLRLVRYGTAAQNVGLAACGGRLAGTWRRPREGVVGPHRAGF